ncbi:WD domain repeat-containing protein 55 [Terramyces sp. JEL0728]|nr:WD domain repeat-containing protein 55 [Terramyces sp. JEL0728]
MILRKVKAHSSPINKVRYISENLVATGDDAGCVKIWDIRTRKLSLKFKENQDYISDMCYVSDKNTLLATSGGGCLSVFDVRKDSPIAVSANQDDELLSVVVVKNNKKAVIGTQSGTILLFSWNDWGDCTDRFPGHPMSVSTLCKSNETTVYTGSSDGIIRAVGILPNQLLGTVGDNGEMPIEALELSNDGKWLASCSHDETVKLWEADITALDNEVFGDELEKDSDESDYDLPANKKHKKTKKTMGNERGNAAAKSFFEDLD